jgi:hypothetical protein
MKRIDTDGRDVTNLCGLHDDSDRFVSDEEYQADCAIVLTIYRDGANPVRITGFATVQQAIEQGEQWQGRLWWRVTRDGRTVAEEPMGAKR